MGEGVGEGVEEGVSNLPDGAEAPRAALGVHLARESRFGGAAAHAGAEGLARLARVRVAVVVAEGGVALHTAHLHPGCGGGEREGSMRAVSVEEGEREEAQAKRRRGR